TAITRPAKAEGEKGSGRTIELYTAPFLPFSPSSSAQPAAASAPPPPPPSCGNSLLPTIVMFMPICTDTSVPLMSICTLSLMFQPSEPVEKSLGTAWYSLPLMDTVNGLALALYSAHCLRVMGQLVFFAIGVTSL